MDSTCSSVSTEQGPAMTAKLPGPTLTPPTLHAGRDQDETRERRACMA